METKRIIKGIYSTCWILAIAAMFSCNAPREGDKVETDQEARTESGPGEETIEELDERIGELNRELTTIERELIRTEKASDEEIRELWMDVEAKRQVLNQTIDTYNTAIQEGAEEEAERLKDEINKQLVEIESEVEDLRDEADINTDTIDPDQDH